MSGPPPLQGAISLKISVRVGSISFARGIRSYSETARFGSSSLRLASPISCSFQGTPRISSIQLSLVSESRSGRPPQSLSVPRTDRYSSRKPLALSCRYWMPGRANNVTKFVTDQKGREDVEGLGGGETEETDREHWLERRGSVKFCGPPKTRRACDRPGRRV